MPVDGILQIHVTAEDVPGMVSFYRDVLGIEFLFDVPGQSMAFFDTDGVRLYVGRAESPEFASAPLFYFRVSDIESEFERMTDLGVAFQSDPHLVHRTEEMELWVATFLTPAGHVNALAEERPISPR